MEIYTIGHSNGTQDELLSLINQAGINCVIDVRSIPVSSHTPQFNQNAIKLFLKKHNIQYLHFGDEFGARRSDAIINGQVNFEKAMTTPAFLKGVERLKTGLEKGYVIALMCAEGDPLGCHRFSFLSRYFYDNGFDVKHILRNGTVKSHKELENEMICSYLNKKNHKLPEIDTMFGTYTEADQRDDAYKLKNAEIGYKPSEQYNIEDQL